MATTLKDIAKAAGVSDVAVSLALRGSPRVAPERRKLILEHAERLDYVPNLAARGLRGRATRSVGVLWNLNATRGSEGIVGPISVNLQAKGYAVYIGDHLSSRETLLSMLTQFRQRRIDSVVFGVSFSHLIDDEVIKALSAFSRTVVVHPERAGELPFDTIDQHREAALGDAVKHLISAGYRRPAFLTAGGLNESKLASIRHYFKRRGIELPDSSVIRVGDEQVCEQWDDALTAAMTDPKQFDAYLCSNDCIALGLIGWLTDRGVRVGQEVGVVGNNNSTLAKVARPRLASISREDLRLVDEIEQLITAADETVVDASNPQAVKPRNRREPARVSVPMRFIPRASAGSPA